MLKYFLSLIWYPFLVVYFSLWIFLFSLVISSYVYLYYIAAQIISHFPTLYIYSSFLVPYAMCVHSSSWQMPLNVLHITTGPSSADVSDTAHTFNTSHHTAFPHPPHPLHPPKKCLNFWYRGA